jgi:hypothetical protein
MCLASKEEQISLIQIYLQVDGRLRFALLPEFQTVNTTELVECRLHSCRRKGHVSECTPVPRCTERRGWDPGQNPEGPVVRLQGSRHPEINPFPI